jgi:UDP-glucose 4-epimerase
MGVRAVVTGGAGFIGSTLVDALVTRGDEVHVVDDLSSGRREQVHPDATLHVADIRDPLTGVFAEAQPEVVFHLAAQIDVRLSVADPVADARSNVLGTLNVLEAARANEAQVILASTGGAIYGECDGPAGEEAPRLPLSPYGTSKLAAEEYLATWNRLYGSRHVALRLGNVYGPRQDPHGEAGVVAIFIGRMLDGQAPRVFGDGLQTRDYVYVGDVVRALLAAETGPAGETVNIGAGVEVSVIDLIEGLGWEGEIEYADARPGELQRSALDPGKAGRVFGWSVQMSLADGLQVTRESVIAARRAPDGRPPGAFATA